MRPVVVRRLRAMLLAALCMMHALAFADVAFDTRLKKLESELRCLVCQNQTLADSNADLAADLRKEVRELAMSGKTDDQIKQYLVARYGDFVLYKPPVKPVTWLLWFGPFLMLAGGAVVWWSIMRRRRQATDAAQAGSGPAPDPRAETASAKARALLDG